MTLLVELAAPPQAVIFDMDGLMLDSERALLGCLAQAGAEAGHALPEAFLLSLIGSSDALTRQRIAEQVGAAAVDALLQDSYARYERLVAAGPRRRTLRGEHAQAITLTRSYARCPACGTGRFHPG